MFTEKTYASFYRYEIFSWNTALFDIETTGMTSTNRITLRLPKSTLEELKKEADEKDLPLSSLVIRILNKNVSFERQFGSIKTILLSEVMFGEILDNMDQATIDKVAKMGPKIVRKLCTLSRWKYDIDSIINNYFTTLAKYCGWFKFKHHVDHANYHLVFETRLGNKWAKFLLIYVRSILESMKIRIDHESLDDDVICFKFVKR
jgi:hypothetical protein